jgi:hypothetical protein
MIIRCKKSELNYEVYTMYWVRDRVHFYCFPKGSRGFSAYTEDEVDVVDSSIEGFAFTRFASGATGIAHRLVLTEGLFDRLLDHDHEAYAQLEAALGHAP